MDFDEAYKGLTPSQKKAVDTVEGPVLVIAGPGTGKTHVLTLRVANILKVTQAKPADILVLTFTDSAARTVRKRLGALIGEAAAREVGIFTFHSFADFVTKTYAESFPAFTGKRPTGDVESTLLWREVLETEEIVHLRPAKSPFLYLRDLESLHKNMVRERITLDDYRAWGKEEEDRINKDESYRYLRDGKYGAKGDMKPDGVQKLKSLEKIYEAARLIEAYQTLKEKRGVYDFSDVLTGVVDALQVDEGLRSELQERYQYLLADEHQDANAYQHALLDSFAYDDHPNLFVVGDEKQAIFRFQGADATHFKEFLTRYPRTTVVPLTESHRSLQGILDVAHTLAGVHIPASNGKHESLSATRKGNATVGLIVAPDPLAEREEIALHIEKELSSGVAPEEIAVIAAKNDTVTLMSQHLSARGIPTLRAGEVSLSSRPLVRSLLAFMRAVGNPLDTASLRESLLAPWWGIGIGERAGFLRRTRDKDLFSGLRTQFPDIGTTVSLLQEATLSEPPLQIFSRILESSGARDYALSHPEHLEDVALIRRLYGYLEEVVARNPNVLFSEAVESLAKAHEHGLEWVKSSILTRKGFVSVITAHRAKGMEWSHVFVVSLTENEWEKGGGHAKIPSPVDSARTVDDAVKQFYVAITRARDVLTLSYATESLEGRERKPSMFIPETIESLALVSDLTLPVMHTDVDAPERVRELTRDYLMNEGLSPSALDEYLKSPPTFFARRVLRMREPEAPSMLIGTAVHAGIAEYLEHNDVHKAEAVTATCLERSLLPRTSAFDQLGADARARLSAYMAGGGNLGEAVAVEKVYSTRASFGGTEILLSGKIDAVLKRDGELRLVDFKTSSEVSGKEKGYARQLAFYDLLLRENGEVPSGACIIQVRTDAIEEFPVPLNAETRAELMKTLEEVVPEMLGGKWRKGEASSYDGLLELFK